MHWLLMLILMKEILKFQIFGFNYTVADKLSFGIYPYTIH